MTQYRSRHHKAKRSSKKTLVFFCSFCAILICAVVLWQGFKPDTSDTPITPPANAAENPGALPDDSSSADDAVVTDGIIVHPDTVPATTPLPDASAWNLRLVNTTHPLPEDFTVELAALKNGHHIDSRAYQDLQDMMDAARAEGLNPLICSSYRSMEKQTQLFNKKTDYYKGQGLSEEEAKQKASFWVAIPGTSEHQSGLALDIVATSYQILDEKQEETAEQKWLMANCQEYGFILRYPTDKSDITGVGYEPWHYRYVGKEAAKEIMSQEICLEEYLGQAV